MPEEFDNLSQHEALRAENEFIKMKLMLEHGADFQYSEGSAEVSPETEHEFLNYIMDFEQQEARASEMSVFEVLGSPQQFPGVEDLDEEKIKELLQQLLLYMKERGIELTVFSPNVQAIEIYRFITEELFCHRMLHMDIPGMATCFIYDEFHPDHPYENSRTAVNECIREIFSDNDLQWTFQYEQSIQLNEHMGLTIESFRRRINAFKKRYEHIEPMSIEVLDCIMSAESCLVMGKFEVCLTTSQEHWLKTGLWSVRFRYWSELDIWMIAQVQAEGIDF
jgi:hypothetical protein